MITRLAAHLTTALHALAARARVLHAHSQEGYTTETIVITAALATLAIAALAALHTKVMDVINGLNL